MLQTHDLQIQKEKTHEQFKHRHAGRCRARWWGGGGGNTRKEDDEEELD